MDKNCRLSVSERDSLNHALDGRGWDLAQHIRNRRFHATALQHMNRVTDKLFRLIELALRRARQEEVVEYQTLCVFLSLLTENVSDSSGAGNRVGEVCEALWLAASGQRSPDYKARAAAAYLCALESANGHMDRRSEEYRHLCTKVAVFCRNERV